MNKFLILLLFLLLSGCGGYKIVAPAKVEDAIILHPAPPDQVVMLDVKWKVMNREKLVEWLENNPDREIAWYILDTDNYENLTLNNQELLRYIKQSGEIIIYYRTLNEGDEPDQEE